jgi:hypothetical protein
MPRHTLLALYVLSGIALLGLIKLLCHFTLKDVMQNSGRAGGGSSATGSAAGTGAAEDCEMRSSAAGSLPIVASAGQPANAHEAMQQKVLASELLKPFILYMQYMLIIGALNIEWQAVLPLFKALGWLWAPTSPNTLSIECLLPSSGSSSVPLPVQKLLLALTTPLLVLLALLSLHGLQVAYKHYIRSGRRNAAYCIGIGNGSSLGIQLSQLSLVVMFFFLANAEPNCAVYVCLHAPG